MKSTEAGMTDELTRALETRWKEWCRRLLGLSRERKTFEEWLAPCISDALDAALEVMRGHYEGSKASLAEAREAFVRALGGEE